MKKQILISKIKTTSTEMLKSIAINLMSDFSDGAGVTFVFILNELEERMSEKEYIDFTESL